MKSWFYNLYIDLLAKKKRNIRNSTEDFRFNFHKRNIFTDWALQIEPNNPKPNLYDK